MKKIIFFILLFSPLFLFPTDTFQTFIDEQIKVETKLLDQNLSLDTKVKLKKSQESDYQKFFLKYITNKDSHIQTTNPYHDEETKLKLRLNGNKYRGNTNAVKRDEVLLKIYAIRNGMHKAFREILINTKSKSKSFFNEKINETLAKYFSKYKTLDTKEYITPKQDLSSSVVQSIHTAVHELNALENVANTFSAEIVANSSTIYTTARFSEAKLFTLINTINKLPSVQGINSSLTSMHLDAGKLIILFSIILILLTLLQTVRFIINLFLKHYKLKDEDINYIHSHITKIFNWIITLIISHLSLVAYLGFDSESITISKLFAIAYVLLVTLLVYRIINTLAYMKRESIQNSQVLKNEVVNLALKVINALIIIIAIIAILKIIGVNLTAILSGLGIAGAAVAFAAKDSISNIFGSLSILLGDVFEQGEWIETKDLSGTVVEIGLRASTIRTFDNALISIPNSELANHSVKNWSRRSVGRRIKMEIGLTYQSDFKDIRQAILDIREMLKEHSGIANERTEYQNAYRQAKLVSAEDFKGVKRTTLVYMDAYATSSINILVYCFSRTVDWAEWLEVKEDVMYKIAEILEENNLEFAYPTMTLHQAEEKEEEAKD